MPTISNRFTHSGNDRRRAANRPLILRWLALALTVSLLTLSLIACDDSKSTTTAGGQTTASGQNQTQPGTTASQPQTGPTTSQSGSQAQPSGTTVGTGGTAATTAYPTAAVLPPGEAPHRPPDAPGLYGQQPPVGRFLSQEHRQFRRLPLVALLRQHNDWRLQAE